MKNKILTIINLLLILIALGIDLYLCISNNFNYKAFYITLFILIGMPILNLIFLIIKLLIIDKYNFNKTLPILYAIFVVYITVIYYIVEWTKNIEQYKLLYWLILLGGILIIIITYIILYFVKKKKN